MPTRSRSPSLVSCKARHPLIEHPFFPPCTPLNGIANANVALYSSSDKPRFFRGSAAIRFFSMRHCKYSLMACRQAVWPSLPFSERHFMYRSIAMVHAPRSQLSLGTFGAVPFQHVPDRSNGKTPFSGAFGGVRGCAEVDGGPPNMLQAR